MLESSSVDVGPEQALTRFIEDIKRRGINGKTDSPGKASLIAWGLQVIEIGRLRSLGMVIGNSTIIHLP